MLNFLIILAIFVAVIIGYKTGFNTGFFAIVFAYLIGGFVMGMTPKDIIGGWPVSTMFVIFSVSLFYNFALSNGTLEKAEAESFSADLWMKVVIQMYLSATPPSFLLQVSSSLCFLLHFSNSFLEADKMLTMKLPLRNRKLILHCRRKICT